MSRTPRIVVPGLAHHVVQRGVRRQLVFFSDEDRERYLDVFRFHVNRLNIPVLAYCLMPNHVHHLLVPNDSKHLQKLFHQVNTTYAREINSREGWTGHLWQERFFSSPVDIDHLWAVLRYIERNPVAANMVTHACQFKWSSAQAHCGVVDPLFPLRDPYWSSVISGRLNWFEWLAEEVPEEELNKMREAVRRDLPLVTEDILSHLEALTGRHLRARPRGRPKRYVVEK